MKLIIAGGRFISDYTFVKNKLDELLQFVDEPIEIVSGSCDTGVPTFERKDGTKVCGVDGLGERYAEEKGYPVKLFPADWGAFGAYAGPKRNKDMAEYGTHCVVIWSGESKGSKSMVKAAADMRLPTRSILYRNK